MLKEMEAEFLKIYQNCKSKLALHKFAAKGIVYPPQQHHTDTEKVNSFSYSFYLFFQLKIG